MIPADLARRGGRSNARVKLSHELLNAHRAGLIQCLCMSLTKVRISQFNSFCKAQALWEPGTVQFVVPTRIAWETDMFKGGLLWLIGIPLPIILILFFMGWLS
jgi:hypothetical protein